MIIQEAKYKKCGECGRSELVEREKYGCDTCKTPIEREIRGKHCEYLSITVFYQDAERSTKDFEFCSWKCCLAFLKKIQRTKYKSDYFISLPYLHFDEKLETLNYKGFMEAIRTFNTYA